MEIAVMAGQGEIWGGVISAMAMSVSRLAWYSQRTEQHLHEADAYLKASQAVDIMKEDLREAEVQLVDAIAHQRARLDQIDCDVGDTARRRATKDA